MPIGSRHSDAVDVTPEMAPDIKVPRHDNIPAEALMLKTLLALAMALQGTAAQELPSRWDELTASDWPKAMEKSARIDRVERLGRQ